MIMKMVSMMTTPMTTSVGGRHTWVKWSASQHLHIFVRAPDSKFEYFIFELWSDKLICRCCHPTNLSKYSFDKWAGSRAQPDPLWCRLLTSSTLTRTPWANMCATLQLRSDHWQSKLIQRDIWRIGIKNNVFRWRSVKYTKHMGRQRESGPLCIKHKTHGAQWASTNPPPPSPPAPVIQWAGSLASKQGRHSKSDSRWCNIKSFCATDFHIL